MIHTCQKLLNTDVSKALLTFSFESNSPVTDSHFTDEETDLEAKLLCLDREKPCY